MDVLIWGKNTNRGKREKNLRPSVAFFFFDTNCTRERKKGSGRPSYCRARKKWGKKK